MSEIQKIARGHINLRGAISEPEFAAAVEDVLGQALPERANTFCDGGHRVYWLGPDEWQIATKLSGVETLVRKLEDGISGRHAAVNDLSGGQVAFEIRGDDCIDVLSRGCTLDLDPGVFGTGDCAQTGLAKANVLISCIEAAQVYEIIVRRSFSEYLLNWLQQNPHYPGGSDSS